MLCIARGSAARTTPEGPHESGGAIFALLANTVRTIQFLLAYVESVDVY